MRYSGAFAFSCIDTRLFLVVVVVSMLFVFKGFSFAPIYIQAIRIGLMLQTWGDYL